ncbi:MAG: RNA polymerase sigma factor RpoD/SigA [Candidatus Omnitrophota bacterium]|jgi:RNA polymerase primary sigma factor
MESLKTYLKEVRTIPLLTAQQEVEFGTKALRGNDEARKKMIRSNLRLVINIAKRYIHFGTPLLDLIEEGNLGLMKAVDKFNPKKGFRFSTYAAWWIRQGIIRAIGQQGKVIRLPVYMNEMISKWKKTREQLTQKLKRVPQDEEIAKKIKISKDKVEEINFWLSTKTSSLEAPVGEDDEGSVMDLVQDEGISPPNADVERFLNKERVENLMGKMSERERKVLDYRFGLMDGTTHTLAEVAKKLNLSRERIRQIEEEALKKLRNFIKQQEKEWKYGP